MEGRTVLLSLALKQAAGHVLSALGPAGQNYRDPAPLRRIVFAGIVVAAREVRQKADTAPARGEKQSKGTGPWRIAYDPERPPCPNSYEKFPVQPGRSKF